MIAALPVWIEKVAVPIVSVLLLPRLVVLLAAKVSLPLHIAVPVPEQVSLTLALLLVVVMGVPARYTLAVVVGGSNEAGGENGSIGSSRPNGEVSTFSKVAVTSVPELSVTWQVPVPEHPEPSQPTSREPDTAVGVSVTGVPGGYAYEHVPGHAIPDGELSMLPEPEPASETLRTGSFSNMAVTSVSVPSVTWQVPVPEHPAPSQPTNREPDTAVGVSVTGVPGGYAYVQVPGHAIPDGELSTLPEPEPASETLRTGSFSNVAVTVVSVPSVTWQVPVPEHPAPSQPTNREPDTAVGVSVTGVPGGYAYVQVPGHAIPDGELSTLPEPEPASETLRTGSFSKVAVTVVSVPSVTWQVPVPEHPAPSQPTNREPDTAVGVSVTGVPGGYAYVQVPGHAIPDGELSTLPEPEPASETLRTGSFSKVAVTVVSVPSVTWQVPVPEHPAPSQPTNREPDTAVGVSVTGVPGGYAYVQVPGHAIPDGELSTLPEPEPASATVNVTSGSCWNVAVTAMSELMVTWQVPVPKHPAPSQPTNAEPGSGVAVNVTGVSGS